MKKTFALILAGLLALSVSACTSEPAGSSTPEESSSVSSQPEEGGSPTLEVVEGEKEDTEGENVSKLDTSSAPEQNDNSQPPVVVTPPVEQKPEQNSSQAASQPPVEQKPTETSKPEKKEDVSKLDTKLEPKPESKPVKPAEQPIQPSTPAALETDDTGWTQAKVDAVVEEYRTVALERGWKEDTRLNIELTNGGAWGLPIDTRNTDYNVIMTRANIEEEFYLYEYSKNKDPEDMTFHIVPKDCGDYWEIYVIFG